MCRNDGLIRRAHVHVFWTLTVCARQSMETRRDPSIRIHVSLLIIHIHRMTSTSIEIWMWVNGRTSICALSQHLIPAGLEYRNNSLASVRIHCGLIRGAAGSPCVRRRWNSFSLTVLYRYVRACASHEYAWMSFTPGDGLNKLADTNIRIKNLKNIEWI